MTRAGESPTAAGVPSAIPPGAAEGTAEGTPPVQSLLERRYRTWLRMLPREYRDRWEEEMVETFLATVGADDPDFPDYGRPSNAEVASVLGLAVRLRLGGMPTQRSQRWGAAARYVALAGMLVNASLALWGVLPLVLYFLKGAGEQVDPAGAGEVASGPVVFDPTVTAGWTHLLEQALGPLWAVAFVALVLGHHRLARTLGLLALLPGFLGLGLELAARVFGIEPNRSTLTNLLVLVVSAVPVAATLAFGPGSPPVQRRAWFTAGAAGVLFSPAYEVVILAVVQQGPPAQLLYLLDWVALYTFVLVVTAVVASRRPVVDRRAWELALLVLAGLLFLVRLGTVVAYLPPLTDPANAVVLWAETAELLALAGVGAAQILALRRGAPAGEPVPQA